MTDLSVGNDTFRVEVEGDATKPVLLLSNSLGSDLTLWDAQMPDLLKSFRIVRYDSRGHGGSTIAGAPYSIATLGRDALGILDALEIETAHFVGISMGGAVGLWLLAHAPHRIERIVLANTSARFGVPETWNKRIVSVLNDGMTAIADSTMSRWFSADFAAKEPKRVGAVRAIFEAISPEGYAGCCAALRDLDLRTAVNATSTSVLIINGAEDASIAKSDTASLLTSFPHAKHIELAARHISNIEADAAFTKAVLAFLTAKSPAKPTKRIAPPMTRPAPTGSRRVGIRRATTARIPLAPATSAAKSGAKPSSRSVAAKGAISKTEPAKSKARKPAVPPKPAAIAPTKGTKGKAVATKTTTAAKRSNATTLAKPKATRTKPVAAVIAKTPTKAPARQTKALSQTGSKAASRPSAKTLKAMAAKGGPTKKAITQATTGREGVAVVGKKPAPKSVVPAASTSKATTTRSTAKTAAKTSVVKTSVVKARGARPVAPPAKKTTRPTKANLAKVASKTKVTTVAKTKSAAAPPSKKTSAVKATAKPTATPAPKTAAKAGRRT